MSDAIDNMDVDTLRRIAKIQIREKAARHALGKMNEVTAAISKMEDAAYYAELAEDMLAEDDMDTSACTRIEALCYRTAEELEKLNLKLQREYNEKYENGDE